VSNIQKVNGDFLYDKRLPRIYKREDEKQKPVPFPLQRYMKVTNEGFNYINDKIDGLSNMYNPDLCPPEFLPHLAEMLGFEFPYEMTEREKRQWLKLLPTLYQSKGTKNLFSYLGRVVYGVTNTTVSAQRFPRIVENGVQTEPQTIELRVEVEGDVFDLDKKTTNFRNFAERFRPVNHRLDVLVAYIYADDYNFALMKDNSGFENLFLTDLDTYDKSKILEAYDYHLMKIADTELYDTVNRVYESYDTNTTWDTDSYLVQPLEHEQITVLKHTESDTYDKTNITEISTERLLSADSDSYNGISAEEEITPKILFTDTETYSGVEGESGQDVTTVYGATLNSRIALLGSFTLNKRIETNVINY
jgi:phage tail-like protein